MSLPTFRKPAKASGVLRRVGARAVAIAATATLAGCGAPVLTPAGPVAEGERQILFDAVSIMLTIVIPTIVATLLFAWWFRSSNTAAKRKPDFAYSGRLEVVIWAVPLLTIMFLGGLTWVASHKLDPATPLPSRQPPLEVQVVSLDWKWLFIYPAEGVASVNTLAAPVGRPIHFTLTSASVMNTFFVPQLGSMIYTMNGMADQLWLQADKPGDYRGLSGMISGDGFPGMHFELHALPPQGYDAWIAGAKAAGPVLDTPAYVALARQSADVKPFTFRAAQPGLFQAVVSQKIAPSAGPQRGPAGPHVFPKAVSPS